MRSNVPPKFAEDFGTNGHRPLRIEIVAASEVETRPVEWLWKGRVPKGKLTMFDGDPGVGKSVVTMSIAAHVTTGRAFPNGASCGVGNVLVANTEDASDDTIVPRLKAHGANLERVGIIPATIPDGRGGTRLLTLPDDVPLFEDWVDEWQAKLLIIDPVMTMLGGDANKDQDARKALTPVADMAEGTGVAVIVVRHLNKSVGLKAIQRGGGNMGLIGVARAGAFFAEHPDDGSLRVMAQHKSNLAEKPPSLAYRIVSSAINGTARLEWAGATNHDADSLAANNLTPHEKSVLDEAVEFLRDELGKGPEMAKQVFKDARDAGIAEITLRRAKTALRVKSERQGTEGWAWRLPEDDHPPSPPDGKEPAERDGNRGDEDDHDPAADKDDRLDQDDHFRLVGEHARENPAYLGEGDQDDQDDHGDPPEHDHDHLDRSDGYELTRPEDAERVRALLEHPPSWLCNLLNKFTAEPDRYRGPIASAVAEEALGTPERRAEVVPLIEAAAGVLSLVDADGGGEVTT